MNDLDLVENLSGRERTRQEVLWEIVASEERYVDELLVRRPSPNWSGAGLMLMRAVAQRELRRPATTPPSLATFSLRTIHSAAQSVSLGAATIGVGC